ncbi:MAG: M1 family metallopeptidase [Planctomycetota bacterium]
MLNVSGGDMPQEESCYDVLHYDLTLAVDPSAQSIAGTLEMRAVLLEPSEKIVLDLDSALKASAIRVDRAVCEFVQKDGRLTITPKIPIKSGREFVVSVDYGGKPRVAPNPPWNGGFTWSKTQDGKPWIATSCQGEGADLWWPCKDQPSDKPNGIDLHISVPKGLVVASNGVLVGIDQGERDVWNWRESMPISNYCVALNIAPYEVITDEYQSVDGTKVPLEMFVLPEHAAAAKAFLPQFLDHVRVFEQILGPYPWRKEKYGVAETPHLGMEHQTIIAYGNGFREGSKDYDWLHNHELAHEWWGNLVTCRDWKDMWIHEGFGTYMQPLYLERHSGKEAYRREMQRAKTLNRVPVAPREHKNSQEIHFGGGGGNDIYFKGSWILHTLRWHMGDEKFFRCFRRFCYPTEESEKLTDGSQVRLVDTEDFVRLSSEIAGEDLAWFFEVYVRQPHLPRLEATEEAGSLHLAWKTPRSLPFPLPVPVRIGTDLRRIDMPVERPSFPSKASPSRSTLITASS